MTVARKQVAKSNHLAAICLPMICLSIHPSSINFYGFARAAVTQTEWLRNRNALSHSSFGAKGLRLRCGSSLASLSPGRKPVSHPGFWRLAGGLCGPWLADTSPWPLPSAARWLYQRVLPVSWFPVL